MCGNWLYIGGAIFTSSLIISSNIDNGYKFSHCLPEDNKRQRFLEQIILRSIGKGLFLGAIFPIVWMDGLRRIIKDRRISRLSMTDPNYNIDDAYEGLGPYFHPDIEIVLNGDWYLPWRRNHPLC